MTTGWTSQEHQDCRRFVSFGVDEESSSFVCAPTLPRGWGPTTVEVSCIWSACIGAHLVAASEVENIIRAILRIPNSDWARSRLRGFLRDHVSPERSYDAVSPGLTSEASAFGEVTTTALQLFALCEGLPTPRPPMEGARTRLFRWDELAPLLELAAREWVSLTFQEVLMASLC